ncbi:hypothetical protein DE146DRAFT_465513 [Phaeosphaeria sp. MPI-PUGE-AT-0046c]|nr:hypothetical protein DE146DRAFT_465513 [Phaeosphaeria sp. MPI-PUGE-AT-0046c]
MSCTEPVWGGHVLIVNVVLAQYVPKERIISTTTASPTKISHSEGGNSLWTGTNMSGRSEHGAAEEGPYDENNPAPPPPGSPPASTDVAYSQIASDGEQSKSRQYATPYRRLNSRKRRNLREYGDRATRDEPRAIHASGRDTKNSHPGSEKNRNGNRLLQQDKRRERSKDGRTTHGRRRRSLKDARKYTPDQIMDETAGRLSPGMPMSGHREGWHDVSGSLGQMEWAVEPSQSSSRNAFVEQPDGPRWQGNAYQERE